MPGYMASIFNCILTPIQLGRTAVISTNNKIFNQTQVLLEYVLDSDRVCFDCISADSFHIQRLDKYEEREIIAIKGIKHIVSTSEKLENKLMSDLNNLSPNLKVYDAYGITDLGGTFAVRNNSEQNFEMRKDCSIMENEPMTSTPAIGTVDKELDKPMKPMNKFSSGDQVRLDINNQMEFIGRKAEIIEKGKKLYYASDLEQRFKGHQ